MSDLMIIIVFVGGILNLILFFKIWSMTNAVSSIKRLMSRKRAFVWDIRKAIIIADNDKSKATEILIEAFIQEMSIEYIKGNTSSANLIKIRSRYTEAFAKAGINCPEMLKNISSIDDMNAIFKSN